LKNALMMFILAIIGVILLGVVADKTYENTDLPLVNTTNETITVTSLIVGGAAPLPTIDPNYATYSLANQKRFASFGMMTMVNTSALVQGTDYTVTDGDETATVTFLNTSNVHALVDLNQTLATYYNYDPKYVQGSSAARTILRLNRLWFALGILMLVAGIVWMQLKKNDLL